MDEPAFNTFYDFAAALTAGQFSIVPGNAVIMSFDGEIISAFASPIDCPDGTGEYGKVYDQADLIGTSSSESTSSFPSEIQLHDIDGDGWKDLVYSIADSGLVAIQYADGLFADGFDEGLLRCHPLIGVDGNALAIN